MACAGFSADTFDRYVLGLLEDPERTQLETHIQDQCAECLRGVQRSMNLWLVFATTLENAQPSEDFRGRLIRIAELSRKVLIFPKNSPLRDRATVLTSTLVLISAVLVILLFAVWIAGRESTRFDISADMNRLAQQYAEAQVALKQETDKRIQLEKAVTSPRQSAIGQADKLERELSEAQAEAEQYKAINARDKDRIEENSSLLAALHTPGARLVALKGSDAAAGAIAYAVIVENSTLVFVAYNLPRVVPDHQLQLWLVRKEDPKFVSAGLIPTDSESGAFLRFPEGPLVSKLTQLIVTEEPKGGSEAPSGTHLLEVGGNLESGPGSGE